ncbi:MAG TPA: methylenetetrahydrofolate reductase [NAD(P)H] [Pseudomonadales bacterium]|nr:methylenetetrahydrofolate reductase [NAD(P)H] [Pseudomonadales bacterium]
MVVTSSGFQLSFEFFPPKSEQGLEKLRSTWTQLDQFAPTFFSVTYGAGGSTRDGTLNTVLAMRAAGLDVAPHLSFGGDSREQIGELLDRYRQAGIGRIVALRGDLPSGLGSRRLAYASELVEFIRGHSGDHFTIEVAAYPEVHPESASYASELHHFAHKVAAGANAAITQYFYNVDAYCHFVEACRRAGLDLPIVPGIMPITNYERLLRFSDSCGAEVPRWIRKKLEGHRDDEAALLAFGADVVTRLCEQLLAAGAPGLHFYSLNQAEPTATLCRRLGLAEHAAPA